MGILWFSDSRLLPLPPRGVTKRDYSTPLMDSAVIIRKPTVILAGSHRTVKGIFPVTEWVKRLSGQYDHKPCPTILRGFDLDLSLVQLDYLLADVEA